MIGNAKLKARYSGTLKLHWQWSVLLALSLLVLDALVMWQSRRAGVIALEIGRAHV